MRRDRQRGLRRVNRWLAVMVKAADSKAWVYKRVNDGILQSPLSSGSTVSLTNGNWYTGKVVVGDDLGNSALQRLRFWIDTDDDGTWSDETAVPALSTGGGFAPMQGGRPTRALRY